MAIDVRVKGLYPLQLDYRNFISNDEDEERVYMYFGNEKHAAGNQKDNDCEVLYKRVQVLTDKQ